MKLRYVKNLIICIITICFLVLTMLFINLKLDNNFQLNNTFFIIAIIIIILAVVYIIIDEEYKRQKKMLTIKKYIESFNGTGVPLIIADVSSLTSQYQTRNIFTGAILYTLPKTNSLKLSVVNISEKKIKGFELQLKNVNVFNEVTNSKLIIVNQLINSYELTDINKEIDTVDFNAYLVTRVIFLDNTIWYENNL